MERDIIVFDNITRLLYKVKEVAGEAILCSSRVELSRLRITRENSNFDIIKACKSGECEFSYLCDAGGNVPAHTLFGLMMNRIDQFVSCSVSDNLQDIIEFLAANDVAIIPWRNRTISLKLFQDKDNETWGLVDDDDFGIRMTCFETVAELAEALALVLKAIKDQTIVENIKFECSTEGVLKFMTDVLERVKFDPSEIELIKK